MRGSEGQHRHRWGFGPLAHRNHAGPRRVPRCRIIRDQRADLPAADLPPSLLADLKDQIGCDELAFEGFDSDRQVSWFVQVIPGPARDDAADEILDQAHWEHYWDCQPCS